MRVVEFAPKFDWEAPGIASQEQLGGTPGKPAKEKKFKKPKKQSKKRLKGGR